MLNPRASSTSAVKLIAFACACLLLSAGAHARVPARAAQGRPPAVAGETARGVELYRRGDNEGALKALREATKRERSNPEAWHYLGLALLKAEKLRDARRAFERAVELRPDFAEALTGLAYALLRRGDAYAAGLHAQRAVAAQPANLEARYIVGAAHLRRGSDRDALEEAEGALKIDPAYAPAHQLKAVALAGLIAEAVAAAMDEPREERPALLAEISPRLDEADAALARFAELDPRNAEIAPLREQLKTLRVYGRAFESPEAGDEVFPTDAVTTKAKIVSQAEPLYTERARRNGTTGTVTLRMVLAADGTVRHILVVRGLPDGLTENAVNAARRIKFVPAEKDGRRVSQFVTMQFNFNIY
jgi:TonB family protein